MINELAWGIFKGNRKRKENKMKADFTELGDIVNIDIMCGEILEHINKKLHSYLQNSLY